MSSNVVASPTSLNISWIPVGGLTAISAYNISYFNTNTQCFTDSNDIIGITVNQQTLTDLQEGTQYSITVTVMLSDGRNGADSITATTMDTG